MTLTLMKPPSGFARRNAGCVLTLGFKSDIDRTLLNTGTGPLPGGPCGIWDPCLRGGFESFPNTAFNWTVAEWG
jgi:hypothetical protein